jgi:hypothetical protein
LGGVDVSSVVVIDISTPSSFVIMVVGGEEASSVSLRLGLAGFSLPLLRLVRVSRALNKKPRVILLEGEEAILVFLKPDPSSCSSIISLPTKLPLPALLKLRWQFHVTG